MFMLFDLEEKNSKCVKDSVKKHVFILSRKGRCGCGAVSHFCQMVNKLGYIVLFSVLSLGED
jgi:hypothetical protein